MIDVQSLLSGIGLTAGLLLSAAPDLEARSPAPQGRMISWQVDFDKAMETAKAEKRIVFVAINMEGERANDEAVQVHYKDSRLLSLSKFTINLFATADKNEKRKRFSGLTYDQANKIEIKVREQFLQIPENTDVVSPQHLFISPEGKVLLSVPYAITVGELEWMFVEALKKNDPEFKWTLDGRARAPMRLKYGYAIPKPIGAKAPTKEEVDKILADLRKGKVRFRDMAEKMNIVIRSDSEDAIKYVQGFIGSRWMQDGRRITLFESIGKYSPSPWYVVVEPFLGYEDDDVRKAAIVATGRLGEKKCLKSVKKQFKKEKVAALQGRCLRAMARLGPKDRTVMNAIKKVLKSTKASEELRMNAVVAAGLLEDRKMVTELLGKALGDPSAKIRSTAAYAIGIRRDKVLLPNLNMVLQQEKDQSVKTWIEAAVKAIDGSNEDTFDRFLEDVVGD